MPTVHQPVGTRFPLSMKTLLALMLVAASCRIADQTSVGGDLTDIQITPSSVDIGANQSVQFKAKGRARDGSPRDVQVTWSATGGTIDAEGVFTADQTVGDFSVVATMQSQQMSASAKVRVRGALKQLVLMPPQASVPPGGQVLFTDYGLVASGDTVTVSPTLTASGGAIDANGMYTAGQSTGTFRVIATAVVNKSGSTVSDTSQITIGTGSPVLDQVILMPTSASLNPGGTRQFAAFGRMSNGDSVSVSVDYSATGG